MRPRNLVQGVAVEKKFSRSILALSVSLILSAQSQANPIGPSVANGSVSISGDDTGQLNVLNSPGAIINWDSFSIGRGELTRFVQQHAGSAVLNRVTGANPSEILGSLLSNGRVFLINRNGIVFGEHAVVDTAGLVASTLNISDTDFLTERLHFSGGGGHIENRGYVRVRGGGDVLLIAPDISNAGLVRADDGAILLAAGRDVLIESLDYEHVRFRVQAPQDRVLNLGRIITTNGIAALFAGTLEHRGVVQADRVSRGADGVVRLHASSAVTVTGRVNAVGHGRAGGDVAVTGRRVDMQDAYIDASGDTAGGRVRIGGDYQGRGDLARAERTMLDATTEVRADARKRGDGGEVVVWSNRETRTDALLSARGGDGGGNGGLVETSSKGLLKFGRAADVDAPSGRGGTWLLDPEDITIGSDEAASISETLNAGGNVSIKTSDAGEGEGNITVASAIEKTEGEDAALSMEAHNRIDVDAPITAEAGKLDVSLRAGGAVHVKAKVLTNGGRFSQVVTEMAVDAPSTVDEAVEGPDESVEEVGTDADSTDGPVDGDQDEIAVDGGTPSGDGIVDDGTDAPAADTDAGAQQEIDALTVSDDVFKESLEVLVDSDVNTDGGDIVIDSGANGVTGVYGTLDASSDSNRGGDVIVLGESVGLFEEATIDASGESGGGSVYVGGGRQGSAPGLRNSRAVYIGEHATIRADSQKDGDGGQIIVFAESSTKVYGELDARGGFEAGDGGFVETSGLESFAIRSTPDVSAPAGRAGTWLIDPSEITIGLVNNTLDIDQAGGTDGVDTVFSPNDNISAINIEDIFTAMNDGATVRVETQCRDESNCGVSEGDILFGFAGDQDYDYDRAGAYDGYGGTLILDAANEIRFTTGLVDSNLATEDIFNLHVITESADTTYFEGVDVTVDDFTANSNVIVSDSALRSGALNIRGDADFQGDLQVATFYNDFSIAEVNIAGDARFRGDVEVSVQTNDGFAVLRTNTDSDVDGETRFDKNLDVFTVYGGESDARVYVNDGYGVFHGDVTITGTDSFIGPNAQLFVTNDGNAESIDAIFNADVQLNEYGRIFLESSEYGGSAIAEFNDTFHWYGGTLAEDPSVLGPGFSFYIREGAVATLGDGGEATLHVQDARVVNQGVVNWQSGNISREYGQAVGLIENEGVWNVDTGDYGGVVTELNFVNRGVLDIVGGELSFVRESGSGRFQQEEGGSLNLAGGNLVATDDQGDGTLYFYGGSITGNGEIDADVDACVDDGYGGCHGGVELSPGNSLGTLNFFGNLTLSRASSIVIELGGPAPDANAVSYPLSHEDVDVINGDDIVGTQADAINVFDGDFDLNGAGISVVLADGYEPRSGESYPVIYSHNGDATEATRVDGLLASDTTFNLQPGLDITPSAEFIASYAVIINVNDYVSPGAPPGASPPAPVSSGNGSPPPGGPTAPSSPPGDPGTPPSLLLDPIDPVVSEYNNSPPGLFDPGEEEEDDREIGLCPG
ncbi:MAG: filamentous hemagglutinin N-terminal domain-containing protein [Proteobacteria bacterium]|nr:MAG: filamentous hemagglutinin N-terminal domain-containing protein [Pseudomonadota bacterium]